MSDTPHNDQVKKRNPGWFTGADDPRRASGPPKRRTEAGITLAQIARDYSPKAFEKLISIIESEKTSNRDCLAAINILFNRGHGLPSQLLKVESNNSEQVSVTIDIDSFTAEVRQQLLLARNNPLMVAEAVVVSEGTNE